MKIKTEVKKLQYESDMCRHKFWSMIYFDEFGNIYQDTICPKCRQGWSTMLGYVVVKKSINVKFTRQTTDQKALEGWIQKNMQHVLKNFFSNFSWKGIGRWS